MKLIFKYWPVFGLITGLAVICFVIISLRDSPALKSILYLQISFLMIHQFEEYVYPGGFKNFLNSHFKKIFDKYKISLNERGILLINVIFGWTFYFICAEFSDDYLWMSAGSALILMINGLLHTAVGIRYGKYNPGLITGLLLFIPSGIYFFYNLESLFDPDFLIKAFMTAIVGSLIIPLTVIITSRVNYLRQYDILR